MPFHEAILYIKSLHEGKLEHEKALLSLVYRLATWTRCEAKSFPDFEDVLNELEGKTTTQKVDDMTMNLKAFAKKNKGGANIGEKNPNR